MTNELGTTLSDIQAKAERKREALRDLAFINQIVQGQLLNLGHKRMETIRKYIEEN